MTKPKEKTREELQAEMEDGKKIRQFEDREKMLRQKLSKEERRTRSHRLIVRGAVCGESRMHGAERGKSRKHLKLQAYLSRSGANAHVR